MRGRGIGRRGPGVVGTVARTAVIAGTATAVSNNVSRRQAGRHQDDAQEQQAAYDQGAYDQQQAAYAQQQAAAAASPEVDIVAQLRELAQLRDDGILTEEEFSAQKARLLNA
jgi:hypothetical protein